MALNMICSACEEGDHGRHHRVVQAVEPGMLGGAICMCKGECKDGRYRKSFEELMGFSSDALRQALEEK